MRRFVVHLERFDLAVEVERLALGLELRLVQLSQLKLASLDGLEFSEEILL